MLNCYLANPLKFFFYNFQNLFWFSAPFSVKLWLMIATCSYILNEIPITVFLWSFLRIISDISCSFIHLNPLPSWFSSIVWLSLSVILANEKITLETMGSQSALSLRLFRFVYPSGFSLKRDSSKHDLSKSGHINKASKKGRYLHWKSSSLVTVKTVFLWSSML